MNKKYFKDFYRDFRMGRELSPLESWGRLGFQLLADAAANRGVIPKHKNELILHTSKTIRIMAGKVLP